MMTIGEARLTKYDVNDRANGREFDVEIEVDFTGAYNGDDAADLETVSITSSGESWDVAPASELSPGAGVYIQDRSTALDPASYAGGGGTFTIRLKYAEFAIAPIDNPLARPDTIVWRRDPYSKPIARDRAKRVIATYGKFAGTIAGGAAVAGLTAGGVDANTTTLDDKPIEIFANPPAISTTRLYATITGYRSSYLLANDAYSMNDDDDWSLVNAAQLNLDGITVAAGQACLLGVTAQRVRISGVLAVQHTWQLGFARRWDLLVLNAGVRCVRAGKNVPIILPDTNEQTRTPWPLDNTGTPLPHDYKASDVTYLRFATTKPYDMSGKFKWRFDPAA